MKIKIIVVLLSISLCVFGYFYNKRISELNHRIEILVNNNKAYEDDIFNASNDRVSYMMTIAEISRSRDSIIEKLNKTRIELGIKDKELNQAISFKSSIKDTVVVLVEYIDTTYIKKDSIVFYGVCDFNKKIEFNSFTKLNISLTGEELTTELDIIDRIQLFDYSKKEWKEPKFFNRLIKFKWGKYTFERYQMVNENKLNKITDFKVIKINK